MLTCIRIEGYEIVHIYIAGSDRGRLVSEIVGADGAGIR